MLSYKCREGKKIKEANDLAAGRGKEPSRVISTLNVKEDQMRLLQIVISIVADDVCLAANLFSSIRSTR